ncbi:MAG: hypothetical protein QM676_00445 [Novosphingobium sp.]
MATLINRSRRQRATAGVVAVWVAILALLFLWQRVEYLGIVALLAEWQFNFLGRSYPAISYLLPVTILALPALLLYRRARRRHSEQRIARATLRSALAFQKMLLAVTAAVALAALVFVVLAFAISGKADGARRIDLAAPVVLPPADGPATIAGSIIATRTSALRQNFLLGGRSQRFSPIVAPGADGMDLQYFVELSPAAENPANRGAGEFSGILRRDALPGEIVRLYRYAGYHITDPHYVLFRDVASARSADLQTAAQLAFVALVFGVLALLQRRRVRAIRQAFDAAAARAESLIEG